MSGGYANIVLRGTTRERVVDILKSAARTAYVAQSSDDVIVFDKQSEGEMDEKETSLLCVALSGKTGCPALGVLVFGDDMLRYWLATNGQLRDEYNSTPGYFDFEATSVAPPTQANVVELCRAFGCRNVDEVAAILNTTIEEEDGYAFESERHAALAKALGLSLSVVWNGYGNISERDFSDRQEPTGLVHVP